MRSVIYLHVPKTLTNLAASDVAYGLALLIYQLEGSICAAITPATKPDSQMLNTDAANSSDGRVSSTSRYL